MSVKPRAQKEALGGEAGPRGRFGAKDAVSCWSQPSRPRVQRRSTYSRAGGGKGGRVRIRTLNLHDRPSDDEQIGLII